MSDAVDNPCPRCGVTLNGHYGLRSYGTYQTHDPAYCFRHMRDRIEALEAEVARLRKASASYRALAEDLGARLKGP